MYHLKISMPGFRQVSVNKPDKVEGSEQVTTTSSAKGHFVYTIEVGFLGEYGQSIERQERMASFYHIERRYSAFLQLHNEVRSLKRKTLLRVLSYPLDCRKCRKVGFGSMPSNSLVHRARRYHY